MWAFRHNLDQDGFVVVHGFAEGGELAEIKRLVESLLRSSCCPTCRRPHNSLFPLRWNDTLVQLLLSSERRLKLVRRISEALDLRWISGYLSIKEPHSPALWWHQDWWCWDHTVSYKRAPVQIAVLCYLVGTKPENGALRVLPGSHHRSAPIHAILPDQHSKDPEGLDIDHPAMSNLPGQVTLCVQAGDAVVIDYRLLHSTHPNRGPSRRDCIILNFTPCWEHLPDEIKAHLIRHPAQPLDDEAMPPCWARLNLLPVFHGIRRDLPLSRNAPPAFRILD